MNYLTALLAFSAIMIVLTTLATVVVEGVHKLLRKRSKDFESLLSELFTKTVLPQLEHAGADTSKLKAKAFAGEITNNPAFPEASRFLRSWPARILYDRSFQELTTRQFVEQFANTAAGKQLSSLETAEGENQMGEPNLAKIIGNISYEFERFGDAASSYFQRRATSLSVIVALFLAFALNIDAFKLYGALASDQTLTERVIADLEVSRLEAAYLESLSRAKDDDMAQAGVKVRINAQKNNKGLSEEYEKILASIRSESARLENLELPIGFAYFPFCNEQDNEGLSSGSNGPVNERHVQMTDPRCIEANHEGSDSRKKPVQAKSEQPILNRLARSGSTSLGWLFSVLVTGGLIGLGAPFWFKTYRYIAAFIPGVKLPDGTAERQERNGGVTPDMQPATESGGLSELDLYRAFKNSA